MSSRNQRRRFFPDAVRHSVRNFITIVHQSDLFILSGSLAFTTILSLAPLLAVLFYVFKLWGTLDTAYTQLMPTLLKTLSAGAGESVARQLNTIIFRVHAKAVGWVGIGGLFITSFMTYAAVTRCFNKIWGRGRQPNSLKHRLIRMVALVTLMPLLLTASIALTALAAARLKGVPYTGPLLAIGLSYAVFALVYAMIPLVKVPIQSVLFGSIAPALVLELAKIGFAFYSKKIVNYSAFYGSFAAFPLFLMWIYISWIITLMGAAWIRALQLEETLE